MRRPEKGPVRCLTTLGAELQVIVDRLPKSALELVDGRALKGNNIAGVHDLAMQNPGFVTWDFDLPGVSRCTQASCDSFWYRSQLPSKIS